MSNAHDPSSQAPGSMPQGPSSYVAPFPHLHENRASSRGMMRDVLIALCPVLAASLLTFGWRAAYVLSVCLASCLATEELLTRWRGGRSTLGDFSATVTGAVLAFSLPATTPWWVAMIASVVAIGIGKLAFGPLGQSVFNPAMVGRAFVMLSFSQFLSAPAYQVTDSTGALSRATPLTLATDATAELPSLGALVLGSVNGSLGETSVLACLIGGVFLCLRGTSVWGIPLGVIAGVAVPAGLGELFFSDQSVAALPALGLSTLEHLTAGALIFGAFFIATDPVTSPITRKGGLIYGVGIGLLTWIIRSFSSYPEGVMFAVLVMNGCVPLINRWTVPVPFGIKGAGEALRQDGDFGTQSRIS